jgi:endonuclease/exonuclease/phosphatase family metal-dependent hydrolase
MLLDNSTPENQALDTINHQVTPSLFKILTLNIAHGRGRALNQMFVKRKAFAYNLDAISRLLRHCDADIVALQEVDKASIWSGRFDHAEHIASRVGYKWKAHANHARSWLFNYGTAILSHHPIIDTYEKRFSPTPPTLRKGFLIGKIAWPTSVIPSQSRVIDIVSVHMDFMSKKAQMNQTEELIETLSGRENPMIILGDFNNEWRTTDSPLKTLCERLNLKAHEPDAKHLATHNNRRIDWILLSQEFNFRGHTVLPDVVSDHQAVIAEIEMANRHPSTS